MYSYINKNDMSIISFVVFSVQMTYSLLNMVFGMKIVGVLIISGGLLFLYNQDDSVGRKNKYNDELTAHIKNMNKILEETIKIHDEIYSGYTAIIDSRICEEELPVESDCLHDYKKVVIGYDDIVKRCTKCSCEYQC